MWQKILIRRRFIAIVVIALNTSFVLAYAQSTKGTYTTTADVPLRSGPGSNYQVITNLPKGITINVVGKDGYWLKVESKHGGKPGYIDEQFARPGATAQASSPKGATASVAGAYETLREVELREAPTANSRVVAKLPAGIKVNVVRAEGDWLRVESKKGSKPGYLERKSVERWKEK
jgi:uncharacterized protein YgiM (DUF1202 family)